MVQPLRIAFVVSVILILLLGVTESCVIPDSLLQVLRRSSEPDFFEMFVCDTPIARNNNALTRDSSGVYIIDVVSGSAGYLKLKNALRQQGVCRVNEVAGVQVFPNMQNFSLYKDILSKKLAARMEDHLSYKNDTFASAGLIGAYLSHVKTLIFAARSMHNITFIFEEDTGFPGHG
jgi:hypothetical protein